MTDTSGITLRWGRNCSCSPKQCTLFCWCTFCSFSTREERAGRQLLLAEHHKSLLVAAVGSLKPEQHPIKPHQVALCRERVFQARPHDSKNVVLHSVLQCGASTEVPSWLSSQCTGWEQACLLLSHLRLCVQGLVPSAKGKLPHVTHSLTQGPARTRGTGFAEQAAIQYFVFSPLFNVWPQAKPCSEYRTGGFLPGFSRGSPRAAARQLTGTFVVKHPRFPNWKLMNREIRAAASHPSECLQTPKGLVFWATLHVQSTIPAGAPCGCAPSALPQLRSQARFLGEKSHNARNILFVGFL